MEYLLGDKDKIYDNLKDAILLDCPQTLLNHFLEKKNRSNTYIIDLSGYNDPIDKIYIKSLISQAGEQDPNHIIYVIGSNNFNLANIRTIESLNGVQ